ncbi:MAG TPA: hypothetical protein VK826_16370 [Bacteroidia bacterium]|nr:hypothetical protein [Bacteroidia bacterium]
MKVTVTVKEVNPEFDHELAERHNDGKESESNILYNWEDEFEISGDVKDFKIRNNAAYDLTVQLGDDVQTHPVPGMMIVDCVLDDDAVTSCAFSRNLVKDTKKVLNKNGDVHFFVFLKGGKKIVVPMTGVYIAEKDFPKELPLPEEDEITSDEED